MEDLEEREVVKKIQELCYANGREKYPKETGILLHQLGTLYAKKTDKISIIQSAALTNAALVRCPQNAETIQEELKVFCRKVSSAANCKKANMCLVEIASAVKEKLLKMRKDVRQDLFTENKEFSNDKPSWNLYEKEKQYLIEEKKVLFVMAVQAKVTSNYKKIMSDLAQVIEEMMGDVPCHYVLVGMGSLAREEVTPYSDFECIIVLEEGIQNKESYDEVLEYFRWYAVLFQLVLINLGETLLPSVGIPSLNDFSSEKRNWFYDAFTPAGVCFDGMMPHACKFPLGRPETESKPWKTELIKPVSEMVKYLESEEDLKNGYHLAELLSKICFVHGNKIVYEKFCSTIASQLRENRKEEHYFQSIKQSVLEDQQKFNVRENMSKAYFVGQIDVKKIIYRSITIFVSALGRIYDVDLAISSCFDILNSLEEKQLISQGEKQKLQYAVAVACEIRLKVYMTHEKAFNLVKSDKEGPTLANFAGLKSTIDACVIAEYLQDHVLQLCELDLSNLLENSTRIFPLFGDASAKQTKENALKLTIMYSLHCYQDCINLAQECIESISLANIGDEPSSYKLLLHAHSCCAISLFALDRPMECLNILENFKPFLSSCASVHFGLFEYYQELNQFVIFYTGLCYFNLKMYEDALQCFETKLSAENDSYLTADFTLLKALCLMKMKRYHEAGLLLEKPSSFDSNKTDQDEVSVLSIFHLGKCFFKLQKYEEALTKLNQALFLQQKNSSDERTDFEVALTMHFIGRCCYKTAQNQEAREYFREVFEILKVKRLNKKTQKLAEKNRFYYGRTLFKLKLYGKALKHFLRECNV